MKNNETDLLEFESEVTASKEQEKEIKKLKEQLKIKDDLLDIVQSIDPSNLVNLDSYTIKPNRSKKEECTAFSQIGDVHLDEVVNKSIVNGLNEYNLEIGEERMRKYFTRLIYMLRTFRRSGVNIKNLVLHLAGDFITGWIHDELIQTNSIAPIPAALLIEQILIRGIKTLAENGELDKIVIPCSLGNHARTTKKNQFKNTADTSYEWWIYHHLSEWFKEHGYTNVEFILSKSPFIYYKVYDKINKFSHGNHFNYQGGIGGIEVPLKKWVHRENTIMPFDMAWIAHWHTYTILNKVRLNGSVIGYNEMGRSFGFTPEPPQMQFQLLDSKRGYTWNCPIILIDF